VTSSLLYLGGPNELSQARKVPFVGKVAVYSSFWQGYHMSLFDLIYELRKRELNAAKAAKVVKGIGRFCLFAGFWNFIVPSLFPPDKSPFPIPLLRSLLLCSSERSFSCRAEA